MKNESVRRIEDSSREDLALEVEALRARLEEAEETLHAIRHGEVDALLVNGPNGAQVFTLQSAEQPYRILIEQMQEGAVTLSREGAILYCNMRFARMLKIPHEKLLASDVQRLVLKEQRADFDVLLRDGERGSARSEITFCAGDGSLLATHVTLSALPIDVEGCVCMIVTDLTELKSLRRHQAQIGALNQRLQRAMTETHHRVKNSLQLISALVDLQLVEYEDAVPVDEVEQLNQQVRTLATVHDVLTQQSKEGAETSTVSTGRLLGELIPMLQQIGAPRRINYQADETALPGQQGVALALIVNELVLNALKHGQGEVEVSFRTDGENATLEVGDDGNGLPGGFDPEIEASTGIYLVENLAVMDLKGSTTYENGPNGQGARVKVTFPLNRKEA